jgi:hypothetical protein
MAAEGRTVLEPKRSHPARLPVRALCEHDNSMPTMLTTLHRSNTIRMNYLFMHTHELSVHAFFTFVFVIPDLLCLVCESIRGV